MFGVERKNIKKMIQNGEIALGMTCSLFDPAVAEIAGIAGYDYIRMDCEHNLCDYSAIKSFIRSADSVGIPVIIRLTNLDNITALNDFGVSGYQIPHVKNAEQAKRIVQLSKYAPVGIRGVISTGRAHQYGDIPFDAYKTCADEEMLIIVQIEDNQGIQNMEEIIAVEGVDVICTGKGDISQALGILGDKMNPKVDEVENKIIEMAQKYNKPTLVVGKNESHWIDLVKNKSVAMAEYANDISMLLSAAKEARKGMEFLKSAKAAI